ncbi:MULTISPECIES: hypothetical protein [unclassified Ligilactobacillus]|uniref:hypothetical protein n=1 Tax=unclassified Ligilactobacillus TaxID=2767920 RepID=UPI0038532DE2
MNDADSFSSQMFQYFPGNYNKQTDELSLEGVSPEVLDTLQAMMEFAAVSPTLR